MIALYSQAASPDFVVTLSRQFMGAFFQYPHVIAGIAAMGLAALIIFSFWLARGAAKASVSAGVALRAQALKRQKDHRALVLVGYIEGPGARRLREELIAGVEAHFGAFAFQAPVQVEPFPIRLKTLSSRAPAEKQRRLAVQALEVLERASGDVIIWGRRRAFGGTCDVRICAAPMYGRAPDMHALEFKWRPGGSFDGLDQAIAYACARRARPVLNRPQDYKPEKLQPIVDALDRMVSDPPGTLSDAAQMEILSDFASGALSLGERGGETRWLEKALAARQQYLDKVDRTADPGAWGAAQQEVGRALAALGEREADRGKLEEAVLTLKQSLDALRATESLQAAEVAMRALNRAEQTLAQRRRIGLRWPV